MTEVKRDVGKKHHTHKTNSSGLDNTSFEKVEGFVQLDSRNELDVNEVVSFFQKGFGSQLVQTWAYYSHINDHQKFTSSTINLTKLLKLISEQQDLIEFGVTIIKDILTSYHRILYRALSSMRASLTNVTLRLINEVIIFRNGSLLDDFVTLFDFTLPALAKLLIPTKQELADVKGTQKKENLSIRYCFIRVLLNLLKFSSPLLRKDFISNNSKILSNWIKNISIIDSDELIDLTLTVWDKKILKEQNFKKITKLKIFNDWNIAKLLPIYYTAQNAETRLKFNEFILSLATDSKYGLKFQQDESWLLDASKNGAIQVNKRNFKCHNKLLYGLITGLKPWEDELQLNTVIEILGSTPELIPPFANYLSSRSLHDPKLTSYWLGQTLLLSKIIRLDNSQEIVSFTGSTAPSKSIISELIIPSVLNRNVLAKCLQSDSYLIRQLSIQLIVDSLQKLDKICKIYQNKDLLDAKIELVNYVYERLPELSTIGYTLTASYTKQADNKILQVALLMALNQYTILFNDKFNISQAISKQYLEIINKKSFSSIDLVLLDNYFQLQEGETSRLEWWNRSGGTSSLFVSLLKIAASNDSLSDKITSLLSVLVKQTVVFNYESVKADPVIALVHSLKIVVAEGNLESEEFTKIWKLLDESISRCVRAPFKYLDQSNSLGRISPLILTIIEQWRFVEKSNYESVSKWLVLFLRFSIIFGEPAVTVNKLIYGLELAFDYKPYIFATTFEASIPILKKDFELQKATHGSFFELITSCSFDQIQKYNGVPVSDFEIVAALSRVFSIVNSESTTLIKAEIVLSKVLSLIGNYWFTHPNSIIKFSSSKFWKDLFLGSSNAKSLYVSGALSEIFSQLNGFKKSEFAVVIKSLINKKLSDEEFAVLGDSLWALESEDLLSVFSYDSEILQRSALTLLLKNMVNISQDLFMRLFKPSLISVLTSFISANLVKYTDLLTLLEDISEAEGILTVLKALSTHSEYTKELIKFAQMKGDKVLNTFIASFLAEHSFKYTESEELKTLLLEAKPVALELISAKDFSTIPFHQMLNIFTNNLVAISEEEKDLVLNYSLTEASSKYTSEISNLVKAFASFNNEAVKIWVNKSILYFTKVFAETTESIPSLLRFIESFKSLLLKLDIAKTINKSNINALLEVILTKRTRDEAALSFAAVIALSGTAQFIDCSKILQIFVNNEENTLVKLKCATPKSKFYSAFIIHRLFSLDESKNSSVSLQEKLFSFYSGSTRAKDLLIFNVLEKMEAQLSNSWIDNVYSWDFLDLLNESEEDLIGETKLIEKKKEGYVITLNRKYIVNGLKSYLIQRKGLKEFGKKNEDNWAAVEQFYRDISVNVSETTSETAYDPLFLCLLVINNDELIEVSSNEESGVVVKTNIRKLVESDLLSSLVINLASEDETVLNVTKTILGSLLSSLKQDTTTFKEKHLFELFVTKLLFSFESNYSPDNYTPLIFIIISRLISILNNPAHMLYEKAFRWILKNPFVKPHEIPLFQEISTIITASEDTDIYYKQVSWLIEGFIEGVKTKKDIQLLGNKQVFEWLLNLQNSPYTNQRIRYKIIEFISAVQKVEYGADALITRYAGLVNLKQTLSYLQETNKTARNETQKAQQAQELLNIDEISLQYAIAGSSKKRLRDWTNDNIITYNKRLDVTK